MANENSRYGLGLALTSQLANMFKSYYDTNTQRDLTREDLAERQRQFNENAAFTKEGRDWVRGLTGEARERTEQELLVDTDVAKNPTKFGKGWRRNADGKIEPYAYELSVEEQKRLTNQNNGSGGMASKATVVGITPDGLNLIMSDGGYKPLPKTKEPQPTTTTSSSGGITFQQMYPAGWSVTGKGVGEYGNSRYINPLIGMFNFDYTTGKMNINAPDWITNATKATAYNQVVNQDNLGVAGSGFNKFADIMRIGLEYNKQQALNKFQNANTRWDKMISGGNVGAAYGYQFANEFINPLMWIKDMTDVGSQAASGAKEVGKDVYQWWTEPLK
jgi:hypothetical protein